MNDGYLDFDEYIVANEPHKLERAEARKVAISLHTMCLALKKVDTKVNKNEYKRSTDKEWQEKDKP